MADIVAKRQWCVIMRAPWGMIANSQLLVVMSSLSFNKEIWWRIVKDHTNSVTHPNCDKQCRNNSEYSRCSRQLTTFG